MTIPDEIRLQDSKELLDSLFNIDKVGERPIQDEEVDREEGDDIDHRARHVIRMMKTWIKKPVSLDSVPDTLIFCAHARLKRGKGRKITIPTIAFKSPIHPKIVYQLDHLVGYYHPP